MPTGTPQQHSWGLEEVRDQLRKTSGRDGASAQIFLSEIVPSDDLDAAVSEALEKVQHRLPSASDVTIGRVNKLAKSVAVKGDADTIAELLNDGKVKAVLPSEISDIYPKPVVGD